LRLLSGLGPANVFPHAAGPLMGSGPPPSWACALRSPDGPSAGQSTPCAVEPACRRSPLGVVSSMTGGPGPEGEQARRQGRAEHAPQGLPCGLAALGYKRPDAWASPQPKEGFRSAFECYGTPEAQRGRRLNPSWRRGGQLPGAGRARERAAAPPPLGDRIGCSGRLKESLIHG
jgi:hypothetical protein